jgi:hypothetical protein
MASTLTTTFTLSLGANLTKDRDMGGVATDALALLERIELTTGTGAGKADKLFYDERTINASSSEDLDLVGSLTDTFGDLFSPVRIKALVVKAAPRSGTANTNNVVIGGASATQWAALLGTTGTVTLRPGSILAVCAGSADATGYVCAQGATDLLKVANSSSGTAVTYQIAVVGVSA